MDAAPYRAIYDEMRTGVTRQVSEVEEVRSAAGRATSVAALAASVMGGIGSLDGGLGPVALFVAALLAVAIALTSYIWWPRWGWQFEVGAAEAIGSMLENGVGEDGPLTEAQVYRELALHLETDFDSNETHQPPRPKPPQLNPQEPHGAGSDESEAYIGDFSQLMVGMRTSLRIEVSRVAADSSGSEAGGFEYQRTGWSII